MIDSTALVAALKAQVLTLEDDLRARVDSLPDVRGGWRSEHRRVLAAERAALSWTEWRDDRVTQAAVAWVLTTVFVRFCEDNALVKPVWVAGPAARRQEALDGQLLFFRRQPEATDREWVLEAVSHLASLPATAELVGRHAALHLVSPSGDAMTRLLSFWRRRTDDGGLVYDFTDPSLSTRFLGDLYQDLSAYAKATFALLQTPVFVEEFILDRTLEPALAERRLEGFRLIDPTCGSGHFLLGAFYRLLDRWQKQAPAMESQALAQLALDAIHGVDLNPFAVAIARFRLTVAAMNACGLQSLESAPAFEFHLAAGDSLLHGPGQETLAGDAELSGFTYETEDLTALEAILTGERYDVVVGNPPYIAVRDPALNAAYRARYFTCKGGYALSVPFMERFFGLAKSGERAGWVGQITSNSFMEREFGQRLVEEYLPRLDLHEVIDSEGAWIPGHNTDGTPTVIIVGRNATPATTTVRAVPGKGKRESRGNTDGSGPYWSEIISHIDDVGWDSDWLTVAEVDRSRFATHPWTLRGGGVSELLEQIVRLSLVTVASSGVVVGRMVSTGEDAGFEVGNSGAELGDASRHVRELVPGDAVRDYAVDQGLSVVFPYSDDLNPAPLTELGNAGRVLWRSRTVLAARRRFGQPIASIPGTRWYEYGELYKARLQAPATGVFRKIASHNHSVVTTPGRLFREACHGLVTHDLQHLTSVIAVLNSSTVCFWLKQRAQPKGGAAEHRWARTYEFTGSAIEDVPLPPRFPVARAQRLLLQAQRQSECSPHAVVNRATPTLVILAEAKAEFNDIHAYLVSAQEELDWEVYHLYGLAEEQFVSTEIDRPKLKLGERAFEIALARSVARGADDGAWFSEHLSTPLTELPAEWSKEYRDLVFRRLELIDSDPLIRLLERPENKRRWVSDSWERQQEKALRGWLQGRLEGRQFWFNGPNPAPRSVSQLADDVGRDPELVSVLALWEGRPDIPLVQSLTRLLINEAVPFLAAYRLKESGLRKLAAWQETWELQRQEDAGKHVDNIPVPPKYTNADFQDSSWWQARGKLDMPKERFILYPNAGRATDPTLLLGWAGWDHAEQALALASIISEREAEGRQDEDLVPLVAGLAELQPWVEQWHSDVHPVFGQSLAVFCREQLADRSRQVNRSVEQLAAWRPPAATRARKAKA